MLYKYTMTKEENILFAKRNLVDMIWKSANLEGISMTFPDTYTVCSGMAVQGYTVDEINAVNDLKKGWGFLFETIDEKIDLQYIKDLHRVLGRNTVLNAGSIKLEETRVGGTDHIFPVVKPTDIENSINEILSIDFAAKRAVALMLYFMRAHIFYDGNKRLAALIANKEMIRTGSGIISIPIEKQPEFIKMLIEFYESNDNGPLTEFIYNNCIDGLSVSLK